MKVTDIRCDVHTDQVMRRATIKSWELAKGLPSSVEITITAFGCGTSGCFRHYTFEHGYFPFESPDTLDFGDLLAKQRCGLNHDLYFMYVTEQKGKPVLACPECNLTRPIKG